VILSLLSLAASTPLGLFRIVLQLPELQPGLHSGLSSRRIDWPDPETASLDIRLSHPLLGGPVFPKAFSPCLF
jgi:hypothetical protein